MRLLVYDSGNHDGKAVAKLHSLATRQGWHIVHVPQHKTFAARLAVAGDFREWLLLHEREAKRGRWQKLSTRHADAFIGLGSGSGLLTSVLTAGVPNIAIVERLDSDRLANRLEQSAAGFDSRRLDLQTAYHRRIEIDLLRTFDRTIANPALVPILIEHGLTNVSSEIDEIEALLTARRL